MVAPTPSPTATSPTAVSATAEPAPSASAVAVASGAPSASAIPTGPTVPVVPLASSTFVTTRPPKARPGSCSRGRATRLCLDKGTGTGRQVSLPAVEVDARGCAVDEEIEGSCSGISAVLSGPSLQGAQCCYQVCQGPVPPCGRPLRVASGEPRVAALEVGREGWSAPLELEPEARAPELALEWARDALMEHASVASFARVALELMSLGAPLALVRRAHEAARDEVEHARLCFSLADAASTSGGSSRSSRSSGADLGPGPLDVRGVLEASTLERLAFEAVCDGAAGEGFAAELAAELADVAGDAVTKAAWRRIADDEARHAELALSVLGWALARGGASVARAAREGLALGRARLAAEAAPAVARGPLRAGPRAAHVYEAALARAQGALDALEGLLLAPTLDLRA